MAENSGKQRKSSGRPFQPGQSGNPGGRPKIIGDVVELAKQHTALAIATLVRIAGDEGSPPLAAVTASNALLDRGWGKPRQDVDLRHHISSARAADADLLAIALAGRGVVASSQDDPSEPGDVVH